MHCGTALAFFELMVFRPQQIVLLLIAFLRCVECVAGPGAYSDFAEVIKSNRSSAVRKEEAEGLPFENGLYFADEKDRVTYLRTIADDGWIAIDRPKPQDALVQAVEFSNGALDLLYAIQKDVSHCGHEDGFYFTSEAALRTYRYRKQALVEVVSEENAKRIFAYLKDLPQISFHYPENNCFDRDEEMRRVLRLQGISSRRIQAWGPLRVRSEWTWPRDPVVTWYTHVAPVIRVRGQDGNTREIVLDPSIMDRPSTVKEWQQAMGQKSCAKLMKIPLKENERICRYVIADQPVASEQDPLNQPLEKMRPYRHLSKYRETHRYWIRPPDPKLVLEPSAPDAL